ncbi:hypothetical protein JTB14_036108 [Gonioctena quinquepunctata]|nr:hypothetical protein JTB14_036108 [Gonioctena quinquepunctata]
MWVLLWVFFSCAALFVSLKIWAKLTNGRCSSKVCLSGKVALVTGGSSGIGYQMVLALLSRGCKVIVADKIVNEELKESIIRETKNTNIRFEYVDLASFESTRQLIARVKEYEDKLDILINNAGIMVRPSFPTKDDINVIMQVNYFSGFLLTHLCIDLLRNSPSGRIIFTGSLIASLPTITLENIDPKGIKTESFDTWNYSNAKFCAMAASARFAEHLKKYNITSNTFHPGVVKTPLLLNAWEMCHDIWYTIMLCLFNVLVLYSIGKTPEEGAQTGIYLATANEVESITGKFFGDIVQIPAPKALANKVLCEKIWRLSEKIVKLRPEEKLV